MHRYAFRLVDDGVILTPLSEEENRRLAAEQRALHHEVSLKNLNEVLGED